MILPTSSKLPRPSQGIVALLSPSVGSPRDLPLMLWPLQETFFYRKTIVYVRSTRPWSPRPTWTVLDGRQESWPKILSPLFIRQQRSCIPTRSFRRAGVCAWTLSFEVPPTVSKFSVKVNDKTFEILLTPVSYRPPSKGKGKGKMAKGTGPPAGENVPPRGSVSKEIHCERIDRLEEQVGRLEQKHETLSEKVDRQFGQVGDQLRQILQCVQPRHREHGGTPPPVKHHRAA